MKWFDQYLRPLLIVDERFPWFLPIIGAVFLSLLGNFIYDVFRTTWGFAGAMAAIGVLLVGGVIAVVLFTLRVQRRRAGRNLAVQDKPHPEKRPGLIALVSREDTLTRAISYHLPDLAHCWLIVTPQMQAVAERVRREFAGKLIFHTSDIDNEYDTEKCLAAVSRIFAREASEQGLLPQRLIADITGGTKPLTAAMVAACLAGGYAMQHIPTEFREGKPSGPLDPIQIEFSPRRDVVANR